MNRVWYNDIKGITDVVINLYDINELIMARREAYKQNLILDEFMLFHGKYYIDRCGNFMIENDPSVELSRILPLHCTINEFQRYKKNVEIILDEHLYSSLSIANVIPKTNDKCMLCKQGWDVLNLDDCISKRNNILYHKKCYQLQKTIEHKTKFSKILDEIIPNQYILIPIPNEYYIGYYHSDWLLIKTIYGNIKIGWRKRVINIDYKELNVSPDFSEEDTTVGDTYIHAWSYEKCKEYLSKILEYNND